MGLGSSLGFPKEIVNSYCAGLKQKLKFSCRAVNAVNSSAQAGGFWSVLGFFLTFLHPSETMLMLLKWGEEIVSVCKLALAGVQLRAEKGEKLFLSPCVLPGPSEPAREAVQSCDQRSCGPVGLFSPLMCQPLPSHAVLVRGQQSVAAGAGPVCPCWGCVRCSHSELVMLFPAEEASCPCNATVRICVSTTVARLGLCWDQMCWLHGSAGQI